MPSYSFSESCSTPKLCKGASPSLQSFGKFFPLVSLDWFFAQAQLDTELERCIAVGHVLFIGDESRGDYLPVCLFPLPSHCWERRENVKRVNKRERETHRDDDKHSLAGVPRAVWVKNSHSIKRNTLLLGSLAKKISQGILLVWFSSINSDLRSCSKKHAKNTLFSDPVDHSHHCLHSFIVMTSFVFCHQISLTRKTKGKWEQKQRNEKRKNVFSAMNILILKNKWSEEIRKKKNGKEQTGQRKTLKEKRWEKKRGEKRREMGWCNECPGDTWVRVDLTLAQQRHDTQQWSTELSIAHAILNACECWNIFSSILFLQGFYFVEGNSNYKKQFSVACNIIQAPRTDMSPKKRENDERLFFQKGNSAKKFLEGLNKWFFCPKKKRVNLSCSNEHDWKEQQEKRRNNNGYRTKTVSQEAMNKWKKRSFWKKRKKKQIKVFFQKKRRRIMIESE